ncbi:glycosyltransferase [Flavobacterium sp.]|uniref:glycosyltransferase n=1 Tax=Flavobacterium sp. TaxID=239 RepID=UPI003BDF5EA1
MIYAQMVGRNEEGRFLEEVLDRISQQVDGIIFTDDCSTDQTVKIAQKYCHVYSTPEQLFNKHEGQLRALAWAHMSEHANTGDWILAIDCDEMLYNKNDLSNIDISSVLSKSPYDVVNVRFYHMWNPTQWRSDKLWAPNNSSRIFRFKENGGFANRRLACGSEPTYVGEWIQQRNYWLESGLIMKHLGYIKDEDKILKHERYSTIDRGEFHALNHINSIIDPNPVLIDWESLGI